MQEPKLCPISNHSMEFAFSETVLEQHLVSYYRCEHCGLLQTEEPYWLDEAYSDAIADTDTGIVSRNVLNQKRLEPILDYLFDSKGKFVDVGGGYGLLCRLMRDIGFDFYSYDTYCANLFAKGFEPPNGIAASAIVAFEVFEHIANPLQFLREAFNQYQCNTIVFSTLTTDVAIPEKDWWYYSFETGQHITFYSESALHALACQLNCRYVSLSSELHLITDIALSKKDIATLSNPKIFKKLSENTRKKRRKLSKTWDDHLTMKANLSKAKV